MVASFANDTIMIVRAPESTDAHGNKRYDFRSPSVTRTAIDGCTVQPGPSQEIREHRDADLVAWTVIAPHGIDVLPTDQVEWRGRDYLIFGTPQTWDGPSEFTSHTLVYLRRWEG